MQKPNPNSQLIEDLASPRWIERAAHEVTRLRAHKWESLLADGRPRSAGAERALRCRLRKAQGRLCVQLELPAEVLDVLVCSGFLARRDEHSPAAVKHAIEDLLSRGRPFAE